MIQLTISPDRVISVPGDEGMDAALQRAVGLLERDAAANGVEAWKVE